MLAVYTPYAFQDCQKYPPERFFSSSEMFFRSSELLTLAEALRSRYQFLPLDLLIAHLLHEADRSVYVCVPSLFQNLGMISTWDGKVALSHRSPSFQEPTTRKVVHDLGDLVDVIRYQRRGVWQVLR